MSVEGLAKAREGAAKVNRKAVKQYSLRKMIDAKCKECIFDPYQKGAWREQTTACASSNCALHEVRPVTESCKVMGRIDRDRVNEVRRKIGAD